MALKKKKKVILPVVAFNKDKISRYVRDMSLVFAGVILALLASRLSQAYYTKIDLVQFKTLVKNEVSKNKVSIDGDISRFQDEIMSCDYLLNFQDSLKNFRENFGNIGVIPFTDVAHECLSLLKESGKLHFLKDEKLLRFILKLETKRTYWNEGISCTTAIWTNILIFFCLCRNSMPKD